jgi:hypothetical protein
MDNNEFLSHFWELQENVPKERMATAAESIVQLVETKQKFEKSSKPIDNVKFKLYLTICEDPSEDLLYTLRRLVNLIFT